MLIHGFKPISRALEEIRAELESFRAKRSACIERLREAETFNLSVDLFKTLYVKKSGRYVLDAFQDPHEVVRQRLTEVGLDSQVDRILASVLDPSAKVKAGNKIKVEKLVSQLESLDKKIVDVDRLRRCHDPREVEYDLDDVFPPPEDGPTVFPEFKLADVNQLPLETWVSWPEAAQHVDFSSKIEDGTAVPKYGPGEERLAVILGGTLQGTTKPYDILTPGFPAMKWEVKALLDSNDEIRPGVCGKLACVPIQRRLNSIVEELKEFVRLGSNTPNLDGVDRKVLEACDNFLSVHSSSLGHELSAGTFMKLQMVVQLVHGAIERSTYAENSKCLGLRPHDQAGGSFSPCQGEGLSRALGAVMDPVFWSSMSDPTLEIVELLKVEDIFPEVDGLFVVNKDLGFAIIPRERLPQVLKFSRISQATPKLRYTGFDKIDRVKFEDVVKVELKEAV